MTSPPIRPSADRQLLSGITDSSSSHVVPRSVTDSKGTLYTGEVFYGERVQRFVPQR